MDRHIPVLTGEVISSLQLESGSNVVDCTVGDGGHSEKILEETSPDGKLLAIDADPESLLRAKKYLHEYKERTVFVRDNFSNLEKIVEEEQFKDVSGIVMDLGWSMSQFKAEGRGFSFKKEEPLDMRYSKEGKTAADIVNNLSKEKLGLLFRRFGEEDFSDAIAEKITKEREKEKIKTTTQLSEIVLEVYRDKLGSDKEVPWTGTTHPATQVFQALRIAVNNEFKNLKKVLPQAIEILKTSGRLAVISFHSLEDGIVKHFFKSESGKSLKIVNKNPITASEDELENNPRARSAKLRVVEKI